MILIFGDRKDPIINKILLQLEQIPNQKIFVISEKEAVTDVQIRITGDDPYFILEFDNGTILDSRHVQSVFFWRGRLNLKIPVNINKYKYSHQINEYFTAEWAKIEELIYSILEKNTKCLGSFLYKNHFNKLNELKIAESSGFLVPRSFVTTKTESVTGLFHNEGCVVKKIHTDLQNSEEFILSGLRTYEFTQKEKKNATIFPALYQSKVQKRFDLKVLVIGEEMFSAAIRSDSSTIDYRQGKAFEYYALETEGDMRNKIGKFMQALRLNYGVFDFAYDEDLNPVFIEFNNCGRFFTISEHCNFGMDHIIVKKLTDKNEVVS